MKLSKSALFIYLLTLLAACVSQKAPEKGTPVITIEEKSQEEVVVTEKAGLYTPTGSPQPASVTVTLPATAMPVPLLTATPMSAPPNSSPTTKLVTIPANDKEIFILDVLLPGNERFAIYRQSNRSGETIFNLRTNTAIDIQAPDGSPVPKQALAISADGGTVAFFSNTPYLAENSYQTCPAHLVDECGSLYIYDVAAASFTRIPAASGWPPWADVALSADGRYVVFTAPEAFLYEGVYLYDRLSQTLTPISAGDVTSSEFTNVGGTLVDISADGRYIVFASPDDGIVPEDNNGVSDIFLYDQDTGQTEWITAAANSQQPSGFQLVPNTGGARETGLAISADGRYVVFMSAANLIDADLPACRHWPWADVTLPNCRHIYLYDRQTKTTELISVSSDGTPGNRASEGGDISADGRFVIFTSLADNLAAPVLSKCSTNKGGCPQVYVRDRQQGETWLVSQGQGGQAPDGMSYGAVITDSGAYAAFASTASNITADSPPLGEKANPSAFERTRFYITDLSALLEDRDAE